MSMYQSLIAKIRSVRRKWRLQALVKGVSLFLISSIALLILGIWGADLFGFKPAAVWTMRALTGACVVYVALRFLYAPLRRRISDVQVAQYVEERYPQLQDRLVTAVECGRSRAVSRGILDLLTRDTVQKIRLLDFSVFLDHRRLALFGILGAGAFLGLLALLTWGPSFIPYGFDRLYVQWARASEGIPLMIEVGPGDVELTEGSDQEIEARLVGFNSAEARLFTQEEGGASWAEIAMEPGATGGRFLYLLVDMRSPLRYYVEAGGIRSRSHILKVLSRARADKIDVTYHFPAYSGMKSQTVENEGDLSALRGTRIEMAVRVNKPAAAARLLFDDRSSLALNPAGDQVFNGSFTLQRTGSYAVQLSDAEGRFYAASRQYDMEAIEDQPPRVTITKPLRDLRATSVEEVFSEVYTEDDIGIQQVELRFSVNGAAERMIDLYHGAPPERAVTSAHTFFLEEFGLQPGDLIAYYARVADNNDVSGPGLASSDIYFIQIRPFEHKYTQSQQGARPGGEGGGEGEGGMDSLSRQQKDIIAATFKLVRDKSVMDPKEYADGLNALALVQSRLQAQVQGIIDRLVRRGADAADEDFARMTEYLRAAVAEMQQAAVALGAQRPEDALPDEQKALQQLLRAESLFLEIRISFGSQQGGGGQGGGRANAEDLADLFELELNKLKNQYETVQRGERQERDQQIDEATARLRELAQRQQQLNERNLRLGAQGGSSASSSGSGSQSQQQLMEEAEKLARQLQRLARERSSPQIDRVSNQLRQAIEEMRQSQQNQRAGRESAGQGIRALQNLEDARRALEREQSAGLNQGLENALRESEQLVREQARIQGGVERMLQEERAGGARQEAQRLGEELSAQKDNLADRLKNLQGSIQDLSRQSRKTQPEASSRLNDAAGLIRDRQLAERIRSANRMLQGGYLDALKGREEYIRAGLDELNRRLEEAKNSVGETREGRLEDALGRTRQLAEGLESMQRRLQGLQRGQGQQGPQRSGQPQGQQNAANQGTPRQGSRTGVRDVLGPSANSTAPPTGVGPYRDEDYRQLRSEAEQRLTDAQELRRLLDRNSTQMENLEDVIAKIRELDDARRYNDPEEIARLRAAIELLRQLELDLSRDLARLAQKDSYLYAEENEAPSSYRKLVEEYYKALARIRR